MKFMMLVCTDPSAEEYDPALDNIEEWVTETQRLGYHLHGDRLRPPGDARTVAVRGGELSVTDGPFTETIEQVAGYDMLECPSLDVALEVASKHPMARFGRIEVRAVWPFDE